MSLAQKLIGASDTPFLVDGAHFDGSSSAALNAALTGVVASNKFTWAGWLYISSASGVIFVGDGGDVPRLTISFNSGHIAINAFPSLTLNMITIGLPSNQWFWLGISIDLSDFGKRHVYINDSNGEAIWYDYNNNDLSLDTSRWVAGNYGFGGAFITGGMAEIMFWPGIYFDLSVLDNRRMLISRTRRPVDPQKTGGVFDTLGLPSVYFHLDIGEAADNFVSNDEGTGGTFTVSGALSTTSTRP